MKTDPLTPIVSAFISRAIGTAPRVVSRWDIGKWIDMLAKDNVSGLAYLTRVLFICNAIGDYTHDNDEISDEINRTIANMRGSRNSLFYKLLSYVAIGYSFCEKVYSAETLQAQLTMLNLLDPAKYDFEGSLPDGIVHALYYLNTGDEVKIPYLDGIHLRNEEHLLLDNSPYGIAACLRAEPFWELHKITLAATAVAIQRQATPLLVGKTDIAADNVLLNPDGTPLINPATNLPITINQGESMKKMLLEMSNSSVGVIDRMDEIDAINQQTDGKFFQSLLYYLATERLKSFLNPPTLYGFSLSGVGDAGLADGHMKSFRMICKADADYVCNQLIEDVFRPQIEFNHGPQDDYGRFQIIEDWDSQAVDLLNAISQAVQRGLFSPEDEEVILKAKALADI